jgi:hypothetical protein
MEHESREFNILMDDGPNAEVLARWRTLISLAQHTGRPS